MREPKLVIATGTKGVGKTHTTCGVIQRYIYPNALNGKKARRVLIYDVNKEYTDVEIAKKGFNFKAPLLSIKDLPTWTKQNRVEVRRIIPIDENGRDLDLDGIIELLQKILFDFRSGMLILEDINRYLIDTKGAEIIGTMATNRHRDLDIYIHMQSLAPVTTRMWQNCQVVRFHKQIDDVKRYQNRIPNAELYFIVQKLVNNKYIEDNRFFCYVDNELAKISGRFSKREFMKAIYDYMLEFPRTYKSIQARFGSGAVAREKALEYVLGEKMQYYGNNN